MKAFGLPVEGTDGAWRIPESGTGLHASGHAYGPDLLDLAREIRSQTLFPVHSEHPEFYAENLKDSGISVVVPSLGRATRM